MTLKPGDVIRELGWRVGKQRPDKLWEVQTDYGWVPLTEVEWLALAEKFGIEEPKVVTFETMVVGEMMSSARGTFPVEIECKLSPLIGKRVKVTVEVCDKQRDQKSNGETESAGGTKPLGGGE